MTARLILLAILTVALGATAGRVTAQPFQAGGAMAEDQLPPQLENVGITERLGERVNLGTTFTDEHGQSVTLGQYLEPGKPLVVAFVYHNCPMLCSLILDGTAQALSESNLQPGTDYELLAISFDPRDTPERANEAREKYLGEVNKPEAARAGWHFLTGTETSIQQTTQDFGFNFRWDPRQKEYAHTAALMFVSPEGVLTRYLYGIQFPADDFRKAVVEASQGQVGTVLDKLTLFCFQYDPDANSYVMQAFRVMQLGGALTVVLMGGLLVFWWRREAQRSQGLLHGDEPPTA